MRHYPALDVHFHTPPDDDVVDRLLAVVDDERPTAVEGSGLAVRIFFPSPAARDRAAQHVATHDARLVCTSIDVPDEDWAERSQHFVTAIHAGALTIAPPWDVPADRSGVIVIQPSMGFGTGHHASTRLCLRLLQTIDLRGARVIDVGTGSGVLAIAARTLGASALFAIDVDEDALTSARENVERNGAGDIVRLARVDLESAATVVHAAAVADSLAGRVANRAGADVSTSATREFADPLNARYDVVLANLTGGMLMRCAPQLVAMVRPEGRLIASGILLSEVDDVTAALAAAGAVEQAREIETEWVGAMFTNPRSSTTR